MSKSKHKASAARSPGHKKDAARHSPFGDALVESCLVKAEEALRKGAGTTAMEWLEQVPDPIRPRGLEAAIIYQMAKEAASSGRWDAFEKHLTLANQKTPTPLYQKRLELARRRSSVIGDDKWLTLDGSVDSAVRLSNDFLAPLVSEVWSCGAYHSRGAGSSRPWTKFLRQAKNPSTEPDERRAVISIATGFFCRFILERTDLLSKVDAVVAIPANPARYNARRMSLPDELAGAVEKQLAVPFVFTALVYEAGADLELRGLSWAERRQAVKGSMSAGDLGLASGRAVLVVDDVVTSGATLSEAARTLHEAGAREVYAVTMSHTEG